MAVERFPSECIWFERAPQSSAVANSCHPEPGTRFQRVKRGMNRGHISKLFIWRRRSLAAKELRTTRHLHRSFGGQRRPPQDDNSS